MALCCRFGFFDFSVGKDLMARSIDWYYYRSG